jgi:5'-nucleotidase
MEQGKHCRHYKNKIKVFMNKRLHILITNDDGVHAKGIYHLWKSLTNFADLTVVAPISEQSSVGLSTTLRQPLKIEKVCWKDSNQNIWSVTGTPADCIKMGLNVILDNRPDLVVSGINRGANLGRNVLYSGTVAGAIESTIQGIPAIAFSCKDYHIEPNYEFAGKYIPYIIQHVWNHPLPEGTLLNVNFPDQSHGKFKGFKMVNQGSNLWGENPDKRTHPCEGHEYYWLGSQLRFGKEVENSDDHWIKEGFVTAVPLHIGDLTDKMHLKKAKESFEDSFAALEF